MSDREYETIKREVEEAVKQHFLPQIPDPLSHRDWWTDVEGPASIFDVSMLIGALLRRLQKFEAHTDVFVLNPDGSIQPDGASKIPAESVLADLARGLQVSEDQMLVAWDWFLEAARNFDQAILLTQSSPVDDDAVEVTLLKSESLDIVPADFWRDDE